MRERISILLGLVVVIGAVVAVLSVPRTSGNGSNSLVGASGVSLGVPGRGGRRCQHGESVPPDTGTVRVYLSTLDRVGGPVDVELAAPGEPVHRGRIPAGRRGGGKLDVAIPTVRRALRAASVCFVNRGPGAVTLAGNRTPLGSAHFQLPYDPKEDARLDWLGPGKRSWWSGAPQAARRFALFKPSFVGAWTFYALALAVLAVGAWAVWLVTRSARP